MTFEDDLRLWRLTERVALSIPPPPPYLLLRADTVQIMNDHQIVANIHLGGHLTGSTFTEAALADLVGQTPTVTSGGNWSDPLGRATIVDAKETEPGSLVLTLDVPERVMLGLGLRDPETGLPLTRADDVALSLGFRVGSALGDEGGPRTFEKVVAVEVMRP